MILLFKYPKKGFQAILDIVHLFFNCLVEEEERQHSKSSKLPPSMGRAPRQSASQKERAEVFENSSLRSQEEVYKMERKFIEWQTPNLL